MKISANEEYGLRIILRVALLETASPLKLVSLSQIAEAEGITPEYAASIITLLRNGELIESVRGKNGGYKLAKDPKDITLYNVVSALSEKIFPSSFCDSHAGVLERCMHSSSCSIRPVWHYITSLLDQLFSRITLAELMQTESSVKDLVNNSMADVMEMIR
ncbi:MAG: Rrf2 family transcriptional regulator [Proteobacteria bacterium]|jgi:Rrf2 family protein|nr:Rrf2 family transcriptional regulator [Pseudomonadota bacterium]